MKVVITGGRGFLGSRIGAALELGGHTVATLGRSSRNDIQWDPRAGDLDPAALEGTDAVIHLAGESIGGDTMLGRQWNAEKKEAIMRSRVDGTTLIATTLAHMDNPPKVLVSSSAAGYYGDRGDEILTEDSDAGDLFLSDVCRAWEAAAAPAVDAGIRTVLTRTGVVVSDEAEAFRRLLLPFKFGAGGPLGSGDQWWALISITDVVSIFLEAVSDESLRGPVNVVSPEPMRQKDIAKAVGAEINRPSFIPAPGFALGALLGPEFVDNVLLPSARVVPAALADSGFEFAHQTVEEILAAELD